MTNRYSYDYHIHTVFSDGQSEISEYVQLANEFGIKSIAFTDHVWKDSDWFCDYIEEIREQQKISKTEILIGFEAKALSPSGDIDASEDMCNIASIRLGSIHRIPKNFGKFYTKEDIFSNKTDAYNSWLVTTKNLIMNPKVSIIAHPCFALCKYDINPQIEDIVVLFELSLKNNTKLEISGKHKECNKYLLSILNEKPSFIKCLVYGSDSHNTKDFIDFNLIKKD